MISKITITDTKDLVIPWWDKQDCLKAIKEVSFSPNLNILWGKNGSGKSSVLKLIAKMFHAEQGGISKITQSSIHNVFTKLGAKQLPQGAKFYHDGQGIIFYDPSKKVGVIGGSFDYDFLTASTLSNLMAKGSSGQVVLRQVYNIFQNNKNSKILSPEYLMKKENVNSVWENYITKIEEFFKPNIDAVEKITILLDEPDRSIDIPMQAQIWKEFSSKKLWEKVQLIIATHSVFAMNVPDANYIELTPGYLEECRSAIK